MNRRRADARAITADSRVGQTTSELLSTKPLFIQLQTPRFFINGDQATVGAIVHNNTDKSMTINVSLDAEGVELQSSASQQVDVAAGTQSYVKWYVTVQPGVKRVDFTAHAASGTYQGFHVLHFSFNREGFRVGGFPCRSSCSTLP